MYSISYYHLGWECNGKLCLHRKYKNLFRYISYPVPPDTTINKPILEKMALRNENKYITYVGRIWCGEACNAFIRNIFDIKCINDEWIELFELISMIIAKNVVSVYIHMASSCVCVFAFLTLSLSFPVICHSTNHLTLIE